MIYSQYEKTTGKILSNFKAEIDEIPFYQSNEIAIIEGEYNGFTHYILNNEVVERPTNAITINKHNFEANGTDEVIISNVPVESRIIIQAIDESYEYIGFITTGTESFTTTITGGYTILIECFPYSYLRTTIYAN